jgi:hypothetical protein
MSSPAENSVDGLTLGELRRELRYLVAIADIAEHPKPDTINPPEHSMAGYEWRIAQEAPFASRPPLWVVRSVDEAETRDCVYVAQPDPYVVYDWERELNFVSMHPADARRLAMALLAAADRADHQAVGVPRLADRRIRKTGSER